MSSPLFRFIIFPLLSAFIGILVKIMSLNHQNPIRKEDIAVAFPLLVASTLSFIVVTASHAAQLNTLTKFDHQQALSNKLAMAPWIIFIMVVGMCGLAWIVGRWGWLSPTELRRGVGMALPHAVAALYLTFVMIVAV